MNQQEKYQEIYADTARFMQNKLKWRGIHQVVLNALDDRLASSTILDVGCGFGRFSFLAEQAGARVLGVDFSEDAIAVAQVLAKATGTRPEFLCADMEVEIPPGPLFDIIYLGGVLEHLHDPVKLLTSARHRLSDGGVIVANCPNESNFRGTVSGTLWMLLDFPMTLSDAQMILPEDMEHFAERSDLRVERIIGTSYSRGWASAGIEDLRQRLPKVRESLEHSGGHRTFLDDQFLDWAEKVCRLNELVIESWREAGLLSEITSSHELTCDRSILRSAGLDEASVIDYLASDFQMDPFFSREEPINRLGGQAIYFLSAQ